MSNKQKQSLCAMEDIINFTTSGDISDLSNLSDDDDNTECETSLANIQNDELDDPDGSGLSDEDDPPVLNYAKTALEQTSHKLKAALSRQKNVFRWEKRNIEPPANILSMVLFATLLEQIGHLRSVFYPFPQIL